MPKADGTATPKEAYSATIDSLERAVAGAEFRVYELEGMAAAHPRDIEAAQEAVKAAKQNLKEALKADPALQRKARPKKAAETR